MKSAAPSRLQADLAHRILARLGRENAAPGYHLVELDLCAAFGVSRTPVRGALKLLERQGVVKAREGRGYVLTRLPPETAEAESGAGEEDRLFQTLAEARAKGALPDQFTQQELMRRFDARLSTVLAVLRRLAELGLVERKPGNGWAFTGDSARLLNESYAFRRALEPQMLLQPGFKLDRAWAEKARQEHQKLRRKPWRPGDGARFHAVNADFHEQLARCCGNRTMLYATRAQNQLRQFLIGDWEYPIEQVHSAIDDHLEILAALEAGYADKAAALMLHHLTQSASQSQKDEPGAAA
ncbi:MAG TPA: GntR family transcriptional regulator [Rhizomicrobium sp.]|nr:GntR family transcriptional regulator [Rhizomicrobium sp.]